MESFFLLRCFFFLFFSFNGTFAAAGKLWSIREMSEMAGYGEHKLSSVVITGSLLCNNRVSGATVAIKCHTGFKKRSKWVKSVTDDFGEFIIHLPSHLHAIPNLEKGRLSYMDTVQDHSKSKVIKLTCKHKTCRRRNKICSYVSVVLTCLAGALVTELS